MKFKKPVLCSNHYTSIEYVKNITYPLLGKFEGTLILGDPQQLHDSPLVWGESADLTDDIAHKLCTFGEGLKLDICMSVACQDDLHVLYILIFHERKRQQLIKDILMYLHPSFLMDEASGHSL